MAAASSVTGCCDIEDSLSCGVCYEKYNSSDHLPKILPCQHTFCSGCIYNLGLTTKDGCFDCPMCCARVSITADIRTNLAVRDVAEAVFDKQSRVLLCPDHHGKQCSLVCTDCCRPICAVCVKGLTKGTHRDHNIDDIDEVKVYMKKEIKAKVEEEIKVLDRSTADDIQKIKQESAKNSQQVNTVVARVTSELAAWKKEQLQKLEQETKQEIDKKSEQCQSQKTLLAEKLNMSEFEDVMKTYKDINDDGVRAEGYYHRKLKNPRLHKESLDQLQKNLSTACDSIRTLIKNSTLPLTSCVTAEVACQTDEDADGASNVVDGKLRLRMPVVQQDGGAWSPGAASPSPQQLTTRPDSSVLQEVTCDLFSMPETYSLVHCVSADFHMGKGIAVQFKKRFGSVDELLGFKAHTGQIAYLRRNNRFIYYLVTKEKFNRKPTMWTLESSLGCLREHCLQNRVHNLAMPTIGCGWDKLEWGNVRQLLVDVFRDTPVQIVVCVM